MAHTSSVSQAKRSWRGEGARRRHMKNPEAATPRMRQHCLAEKPCPASSSMTGYLALGRTPLLSELELNHDDVVGFVLRFEDDRRVSRQAVHDGRGAVS